MKITLLILLFVYSTSLSVADQKSVIVRGVQIPLRDRVKVAGDYFIPEELGQYPTILEVTPYRRNSSGTYMYEYEHWNRNGFAFIVVDNRGQGDSEGEFDFFGNDTNDSYDILEWIAQQPWSNGKVAMRGSSYTGTNQLYAARSGSPYLSCITPSCAAETSPALESPAYHSGILSFQWALQWVVELSDSGVNSSIQPDWDALLNVRPLKIMDEIIYGKPLKLYDRFLEHAMADSYWTNIELDEEEFRKIDIPTLTFSGWFDGTLPGSIANYKGLKNFSPSPDKHFIVIGPWTHVNAPDGGYNFVTGEAMLSVGEMQLPEAAVIPGLNITTDFYNWCLKDGLSPHLESHAMIYLTGSNTWLNLTDYPPENLQVLSYYLSSSVSAKGVRGDGRLILNRPADEPADEIIHDPLNPVKNYEYNADGVYKSIIGSLPIGISGLLDRNDILVYISDPLVNSLTVLGNVKLHLYVSTDVLDADFHAILEDVSPDGTSIKLGPREAGLGKARFRNGYAKETPVEPKVPFEITVNMYDMGHTFLPGHKLRLSIMCSMYPRTFPNPGTGGLSANDTEKPRIARNLVFHDTIKPSHLLLPVYNL